jgi:hypothetical protein
MLSLYRRHKKDCVAHETTSLSPRAKRRFMGCTCPVWIYGNTKEGHVPRQSTGTSDLAVAEAKRQFLLRKDHDNAVHGPRIDDCIERFIASRKSELGEKTAESYEFQLERLRAYCAGRGIHLMRELTGDLLEDFKVQGLPESMRDTTKSIVVAKLRCFLRVAFRREWINIALAERVTSHSATYEQKAPYSDQEINLILTEAEKLNGGRGAMRASQRRFGCYWI